ncbi:MAG: hypothetical protein Q4D21_10410 [Phascolarctobacterium sp.]|nr:hypothetical protein [Phascolarctobacterium sp.]
MVDFEHEKETDELLNQLNNVKTEEELQEFLKDNEDELNSYNALLYFESCWLKYGFKTQAQVIRNSELGHNAYHYLDGRKRLTRDRALCLSLAVHMSLEEVNTFLKYLGLAQLYARDRRDAIVIFAINKKYSVHDTNAALYEAGLGVLCEEK